MDCQEVRRTIRDTLKFLVTGREIDKPEEDKVLEAVNHLRCCNTCNCWEISRILKEAYGAVDERVDIKAKQDELLPRKETFTDLMNA